MEANIGICIAITSRDSDRSNNNISDPVLRLNGFITSQMIKY